MIATFDFINHASGVTLAAVLNTAWISLAAAAVVWTALRFTPRVNAATRHAAWWAVLAIVVAVPFVFQTFSPRSSSSRSATTQSAGTQTSAASSLHQRAGTVARDHFTAIRSSVPPITSQPDSQTSSVDSQSSVASTSAAPRVVLPFEFRAGNWPEILFAVWLAIFVLLFARVASSYIHLRNVRRRSYSATGDAELKFQQCLQQARMIARPRLLVSREIFSPLAAGFLHPVVILPEQLLNEMSGPELEYVLLHELAHFARSDNWTNLLARLATPVFTLHPVAAWTLSRIEREREIACDDWAVAVSGSPRQYAATLARLFEVCGTRRRELLATGMAHKSSRLGERIEMLMKPKREFAARTSFTRLALSAAAGLVVLAIGTQMPGWITLAQDASTAPAVVITAKRLSPPPQSVQPSPMVQATQAMREAEARAAQENSALPALPIANNFSIDPPGQMQDHGRMFGPGWTPEWTIERSRSSFSDKVQLSFGFKQGGSEWINETDVPISTLRDFSLSMLDKSGPIKFEYVRAAGELICGGTASHGRASGTFTVKENPEFTAALEKMGYRAPDEQDVVSLMMSDVTLDFARDVKATGLDLSAGDLGELRSHGVTPDYIRKARQAGLTKLSADDFCELRTHGVEPEYLQRIFAVDPKLSTEDICELRTHGVEPEYLKGIEATGLNPSIEDICELRTHGVEPTYLKNIHDASSKLSIDEIDELRTHGVEADYLKRIQATDSNLSMDEICELRTHGVEPDYLKGIREAKKNLSIDEIDELRTHGVEPEYLKGIEAADSKLSAEEISELRTHGAEPGYYRDMKAVDGKLSIEEIDELRTHGVEAEYLKEMKAADPNMRIEEMNELRTHGVPATFVSQAIRMGYHFTAEELSDLWTHGVDEAYLRNLQDMGMKNLTSKQILRLRGSS